MILNPNQYNNIYFIYLDDQHVTCMWSTTGHEYSGKTANTCTGTKCVPWSRSMHKLRQMLNIKYDKGGTWGILNIFPDRSLAEASNYCRNPSNDACGPWCYTSLVDDSKGHCCVPECSAANKGRLIQPSPPHTSHNLVLGTVQ